MTRHSRGPATPVLAKRRGSPGGRGRGVFVRGAPAAAANQPAACLEAFGRPAAFFSPLSILHPRMFFEEVRKDLCDRGRRESQGGNEASVAGALPFRPAAARHGACRRDRRDRRDRKERKERPGSLRGLLELFGDRLLLLHQDPRGRVKVMLKHFESESSKDWRGLVGRSSAPDLRSPSAVPGGGALPCRCRRHSRRK